MADAPSNPSETVDAEPDADADAEADPEPASPVPDFSPATVPYNEDFENALMTAILYNTSAPEPLPPVSPAPVINPTTLPIPVDSPLRTYASPIPGIRLTHVNGYHTGGPGPTPETVAEFARKFIESEGVEDAGQLERVVEERIREKMEVVRERMREREEAVTRNRNIQRELEELNMLRAAELSVAEKIKGGRERV